MLLRNVFITHGFDVFQMLRTFPPVRQWKTIDFKIICSKKSMLGHMGKRKMASTVFLQLSFGIDGFFLKMFMWCCEMFLLLAVSTLIKCCEVSLPFRQWNTMDFKIIVAKNQGLATWVSEKWQIQFFLRHRFPFFPKEAVDCVAMVTL